MKLRDCTIAEASHTVLDGLGDNAIGLQLAVERKLTIIGDPELSWQTTSADTGFFRALSGKRRDALVVEHARLSEYAVVLICRGHGAALHVSWLVVVTPRVVRDMVRAVRFNERRDDRFAIGAELDVFDVADLKAFVGITRLALTHAIQELTDADDEDGDSSVPEGI